MNYRTSSRSPLVSPQQSPKKKRDDLVNKMVGLLQGDKSIEISSPIRNERNKSPKKKKPYVDKKEKNKHDLESFMNILKMVEPPNGDISIATKKENIDFTPIPYKPVSDEFVEMDEQSVEMEESHEITPNETLMGETCQDNEKGKIEDVSTPIQSFDKETENQISALLQKKSEKRGNDQKVSTVERWKRVKVERKRESKIRSYWNVLASSILYGFSTTLSRDIRVFHLTDIHVEPDYTMGAPARCVEYPCCRSDSVPANITFPAPKYGDHYCDSAPEFVNDSFEYFAEYFERNPDKKPDYILMTGDQGTHRARSTQTAELNTKLVRYVFNTYKKYFGKYHTIPVFGNHDTFPEGQMALPPENRWMTEVMAELWKDWIPDDQMENVLYGGYYTKLIAKNWRVIGLNSLWDYSWNTKVEGIEDAAEQKAFTRKWLEHARRHNETVWIVAHIAAGSEVFEPFNVFYSDIIREYSDIIAASFYGHTHSNHFYIVRDQSSKEKTPLHVNFVTSAFEGIWFNNPSACLFIIDEETKRVKDYYMYVATFDEMQKTGQLAWKEVYSIKEAMGVKDLSPASIAEWAERMWDDQELFEQYMYRYHTFVYNRGECDHQCKVENLCSLLYIIKEDREECMSKHI